MHPSAESSLYRYARAMMKRIENGDSGVLPGVAPATDTSPLIEARARKPTCASNGFERADDPLREYVDLLDHEAVVSAYDPRRETPVA